MTLTERDRANSDAPPPTIGFDTTLRNPTLIFAQPEERNPRSCPSCGDLRSYLEPHHCRVTGRTDDTVSIQFTRWLPGDPTAKEPATHTLDIVDEIDRLVDQQMAGGEPWTGFDAGDPTYPKCPHCERHWHGLPITQRIATMYAYGDYDEECRVDTDDSPVVCPGSPFIGPRRPTPYEQRQANTVRTARDINMVVHIRPQFDMTAWRTLFERARVAFAGVGIVHLSSWMTANPTYGRPRPLHCQPRNRSASLAYDELWRVRWRSADPFTWVRGGTLPAPLVKIEFGPSTWHYELQRDCIVPLQLQFPGAQLHRPWTPLAAAVWDAWREFTRPNFPLPPRPGYDFTCYDTFVNDNVPGRSRESNPNVRYGETTSARTSQRGRRGRRRA